MPDTKRERTVFDLRPGDVLTVNQGTTHTPDVGSFESLPSFAKHGLSLLALGLDVLSKRSPLAAPAPESLTLAELTQWLREDSTRTARFKMHRDRVELWLFDERQTFDKFDGRDCADALRIAARDGAL